MGSFNNFSPLLCPPGCCEGWVTTGPSCAVPRAADRYDPAGFGPFCPGIPEPECSKALFCGIPGGSHILGSAGCKSWLWASALSKPCVVWGLVVVTQPPPGLFPLIPLPKNGSKPLQGEEAPELLLWSSWECDRCWAALNGPKTLFWDGFFSVPIVNFSSPEPLQSFPG